MAVVIRYFSTAADGDGTGTSWANRARLLDAGGAYDDYIENIDCTSDSYLCYVGPGTYEATESLAAAVFAVAPTAANPIILHGCDSSGVALEPPDPDWVSAQPPWDDSGLPVIQTGSNILTTNCFSIHRLIKYTASVRNGAIIGGAAVGYTLIDWCVVINSTSNASALAVAGGNVTNSVLACSANTFNAIYEGSPTLSIQNCRVIGGGSGGSGFRGGLYSALAEFSVTGCTIAGCVGGAIVNTSTNAARPITVSHCTIINRAGPGVLGNNTASPTATGGVRSCYIADCTTGVDSRNGLILTVSSRVNGNTENFANAKNIPTTFNDVSAFSATELVSYVAKDNHTYAELAGYDYRVAANSTMWGKGYGAGDQVFLKRPKAGLAIVGG